MKYRASDLYALYSFCPHLESAIQPQITTNFLNPFSAPSPPFSTPASATSNTMPSASESMNFTESRSTVNNAIICVRVGPSPDTPSLLCVTSAHGALYVRPLPDFVRWERTRIPSALSQLVNVPIQAVRGTILQVCISLSSHSYKYRLSDSLTD